MKKEYSAKFHFLAVNKTKLFGVRLQSSAPCLGKARQGATDFIPSSGKTPAYFVWIIFRTALSVGVSTR